MADIQKIMDATIVTGEYQNAHGENKKSYLKIGTLFVYADGGMSLKLDAMPIGGGNISFYERKPKDGQQQNSQPQQQQQQQQQQQNQSYQQPQQYQQQAPQQQQQNNQPHGGYGNPNKQQQRATANNPPVPDDYSNDPVPFYKQAIKLTKDKK
jgi:ATPase subunit of ABC transporter with duplicated ATPase domains